MKRFEVRKAPAAPPAYRPQSAGAQAKMAAGGAARTPPSVPPAYRPQHASAQPVAAAQLKPNGRPPMPHEQPRAVQPRLHSPLTRARGIVQAYYAMVGYVETGVATGYSADTKTFTTTKKRLPEYKITDTSQLFYSATKRQHVESIAKSGFKTEYGGNGSGSVEAPANVGQYNSRGYIYFFNSGLNAKKYGQNNVDGDFVVVAFTLPAGATFHPDPESGFNDGAELSATQALRTSYDIPARNIREYMAYDRAQIGRPYELFPNRNPVLDPAFFESPQ